nr:hypothetical protein GCM10020092_077190 [Actinoplanes digitatis]
MAEFLVLSRPYPLARHLGLRLVAPEAAADGWGEPLGVAAGRRLLPARARLGHGTFLSRLNPDGDRMKIRISTAAIAALALVAAAGAAAPKWTFVPAVPLPAGVANSQLRAVTAVSARDLWVGGAWWDKTQVHPLLAHWDGTAWTVPALPALPQDAYLTGGGRRRRRRRLGRRQHRARPRTELAVDAERAALRRTHLAAGAHAGAARRVGQRPRRHRHAYRRRRLGGGGDLDRQPGAAADPALAGR